MCVCVFLCVLRHTVSLQAILTRQPTHVLHKYVHTNIQTTYPPAHFTLNSYMYGMAQKQLWHHTFLYSCDLIHWSPLYFLYLWMVGWMFVIVLILMLMIHQYQHYKLPLPYIITVHVCWISVTISDFQIHTLSTCNYVHTTSISQPDMPLCGQLDRSQVARFNLITIPAASVVCR